MNRIRAVVTAIDSVDNLTIIALDAEGTPLRMMALGLNIPVEVGSRVVLGVKASHIALARECGGEITISNRLPTVIESVNNGTLVSSIKLRFDGEVIESIITRESSLRLELQPGDGIIALIKASDLSILEMAG